MTQEQEKILEVLKKSFRVQNEVNGLKAEIEEKDIEIEKLEEEVEKLMPIVADKTINFGIGKINYSSSNLQLSQLMEALESAINKHNPGFILQVLETIS